MQAMASGTKENINRGVSEPGRQTSSFEKNKIWVA